MAEIRIVLAAETPKLQRMMETYCMRDPSLSIAAKPATLRYAEGQCVQNDADILVIWVEHAPDEAMTLFRSVLASTHTSVVMMTNNTMLIVEAIANGLEEFITYSAVADDEMRNTVAMRLPETIQKAYRSQGKRRSARVQPKTPGAFQTRFKGIIALGASAGGTEATSAVLRQLPANLPGMVIVQHIPPVFSKMYAERLDRECAMNVREARDWDAVEPGVVLVAPGDRQMTVTRKGDKFAVRVQPGERVSGHCPSVDALFHSVAMAAGSNAVGIILTGMGEDGARGLLQMRRAGAYTLGQDEQTSMVYGMPRVAYELGGVARQAPLGRISTLLLQHLASV